MNGRRALNEQEKRDLETGDRSLVFRFCPLRGTLQSVRDMDRGHLVAHALSGPTEPENLFMVSRAGNDDMGSKTWPEVKALVEARKDGFVPDARMTADAFLKKGDAAWARETEKALRQRLTPHPPKPKNAPNVSKPDNDVAVLAESMRTGYQKALVHLRSVTRIEERKPAADKALAEFEAGKNPWTRSGYLEKLLTKKLASDQWVIGEPCKVCGSNVRRKATNRSAHCVPCNTAQGSIARFQ